MKSFVPALILFAVGAAAVGKSDSTVTFIHTNDLHAHANATKVQGIMLGGYARQATLINQLRGSATNPVLLSGGDTFQGTLYFNEYEGLADLSFMNVIGYQAAAVGNHEFDRGPAVLAKFIKNARFPLLAANLDVSNDPDLRGLIQPSTVLQLADGSSLGIVGAITPDVTNISSTGKMVKLRPILKSIQDEVDRLRQEGINRVILLTHVGYTEEIDLAKKVKGIDVIVGGHSHTLLGDTGLKGIVGEGPYPTVVQADDKRTVLVVQAWEWGKVVGKLKVTFDDKGDVKAWEGGPVPVTDSIAENPYITQLYNAFDMPIAKLRSTPVGTVDTELKKEMSKGGDSTMGNVIADSMLGATKKFGSVAAFANLGGVRSGLQPGPATYGNLIEVAPFANTLVVLQLTGRELKSAIEESQGGGMLLPSKGTSYSIVADRAPNHRIDNLIVGGQAVLDDQVYTVTFNSFTAGGGDKHATLESAKGTRIDTGIVDLDALIDYFKAYPKVSASDEHRVRH